MTFLARLLLFLFLAFSGVSAQSNSRETVHKSMHEVLVTSFEERGRCTAYAVGPHTIAIAEHCIGDKPEPEPLLFTFEQDGGIMATNAETILDGNDHALIVLEDIGLGGQFAFKGFDTWIHDAFPANIPQQGDRVFRYGAPAALLCHDCYREGLFMGFSEKTGAGVILLWFQMPSAAGDSGALIFDEMGHVAGEVSIGGEGFVASTGFVFSATDLQHIK